MFPTLMSSVNEKIFNYKISITVYIYRHYNIKFNVIFLQNPPLKNKTRLFKKFASKLAKTKLKTSPNIGFDLNLFLKFSIKSERGDSGLFMELFY